MGANFSLSDGNCLLILPLAGNVPRRVLAPLAHHLPHFSCVPCQYSGLQALIADLPSLHSWEYTAQAFAQFSKGTYYLQLGSPDNENHQLFICLIRVRRLRMVFISYSNGILSLKL